ncbi:hypothetical protein [Sphingomonas montana]|uniref:hypothetical protein n=1 Tax=Sphingomonas montana TaxID=1843236 RepID=UPI00096DC73E|nr:hypothetical protein [Sphingomonas montana]
MGKGALIKIGIGAAIIGAAFLTGGASILPSIAATSGTVAGVTVATAAIGTALTTTAIGAMALAAGASIALSGVSQAFAKAPSVSLSQIDRLNASMVPSAPRKMVFGQTAMATDIRYVEPSGENQEYIDYIIAVASHAVQSIDEIWLEDTIAWRAEGDVQGKYRNYLSVNPVLEGSAGNAIAINGGGKWGSSRRLTGCAYLHLRIKRTGNGKKAESPFSGGLPGRMTITGRGAKLYDPRRDSTIPGGSGPMRAADQSTWRYVTDDGATIGENLTLQALWYLLGWRINGKLAVGRGLPADRLNLVEWIEAANLADEQVQLASGGMQTRYTGAGVTSEGDDPGSVLQTFAVGCNARFRDGGGKLSLSVMHNDLAAAATDDGLTDDDVLSPFTWNPDPALEQTYNIVRGRYTDPSPASLYQLVDYPEVSLPSPDGIDRVMTLDLAMIEDAARAQRIAKQVLQRKQYDRTFTATFGARAWAYQVGDVLPFTFSPLGFDRALFRIQEQQPTMDGTCPMVLTVEHQQIYVWDRDDSAAVVAAEPVRYDPLNNAIILAVAEADGAYLGTDQIPGNLYGPDGVTPVHPDDVLNDAISLTPDGRLLQRLGNAIVPLGTLDLEAAGGVTDAALAVVREAAKAGDRQVAAGTAALAEASQSASRQIDRALMSLTDALTLLSLDAQRTRDVLRDAGIVIDPVTGTARIYAIDRQAETLSQVAITLAAQQAAITLSATRTYVNEQIVLAQLDPSQTVGLEQIIARITASEIDIDALNGQVALKADAVTLTTLSQTVTTVSQVLDALAGTVSTKADSTVLNALGARVASAEQVLTALGDVSSVVTQLSQARYSVRAAADNAYAQLGAVVAGEADRRYTLEMLATARSELYSRLVDGDAAEAGQRLQLAAKFAATTQTLMALYSAETLARATGDDAVVRQIETLAASIAGQVDRIDAQSVTDRQARVDGDSASATALEAVRAGLADADAAISADVAEKDSASVTRDAANADRIETVRAALDATDGALAASITDVHEAAVERDAASARRIEEVKAGLDATDGQIAASVVAVNEASVDRDEANASRTDQVRADLTGEVGAVDARVTQEASASVERDNANAGLVAQVAARLDGAGGGGVTVEQALLANASAINGVLGEYTVKIQGTDSAGNPIIAGFGLIAGEGVSEFAILAGIIRVGTGKLIFDSGTHMKVLGVGFGGAGDLLEWSGPTMPIASCTRANAISYLTIRGDAYFGGSLTAGELGNATTGSSTAADAQAVLGPFRSNGGRKDIVLSYAFAAQISIARGPPGSFQPENPTATLVLEKLVGGSFSTVATLRVTGTYGYDPPNPQEAGFYAQQMGGSLTYTDNATETDGYQYRARLTLRNAMSFGDPITQSITIVSSEE